jgi:CRP-like cAMP-binding protein
VKETEERGQIRHSLISALRRVPAFVELDEYALLQLFGASFVLAWRPGSTVFHKGDEGDALYVVLSGAVQMLDEDGSGGEIEVRLEGPGVVFGELSIFLDEVRSLTVRAVEETELFVLPRKSFEALLAADADLRAYFDRLFAERAEAWGRSGPRTGA